MRPKSTTNTLFRQLGLWARLLVGKPSRCLAEGVDDALHGALGDALGGGNVLPRLASVGVTPNRQNLLSGLLGDLIVRPTGHGGQTKSVL